MAIKKTPTTDNQSTTSQSTTNSTPKKTSSPSSSTRSTGLIDRESSTRSVTERTTSALTASENQTKKKTKITIKYDVGFNNSLYIRGKGANLSWEKGTKLKNTKADEWVFESDVPFSNGEFKVLINDQHYEVGPNHTLNTGATIQYTPRFH